MKERELEAYRTLNSPERERQKEREVAQSNLAIETFNKRSEEKRKDGKAYATPAGRFLTDSMMSDLIAAIETDVEAERDKPANHQKGWYKLLRDDMLSSRALATIAARTVTHAALHSNGLVANTRLAGRYVEYNINMNRYHAHDAKALTYSQRRNRNAATDYAAERKMLKSAERDDVNLISWSDNDKSKVGSWLLGHAWTVSPYIERATEVTKSRDKHSGKMKTTKRNIIRLTPEGSDRVEDEKIVAQDGLLAYWPMVIKPNRWTTYDDGGYIRDNRCTMVRRASKGLEMKLRSDPPEAVMEVLNILQEVPHKINVAVLEVMKAKFEEAKSANDTSLFGEIVEPDAVEFDDTDIDWSDMTQQQMTDYAKFRSDLDEADEARREARSRLRAIGDTIAAAERDMDEAELYFVHNLDRRGRVYPSGSSLNPQGSKFEKALLTASDSVLRPLGDDGAGWLAVHMANLYGYDKVTFEDRVEWVNDHADEIIKDIADPYREDAFWLNADSPFEFLGAEFKYGGWLVEGDDYMCDVAAARDGSNSGLQHFSAAMLDTVGASKVNVTPSDLPADIYEEVRQLVIEQLGEIKPGNDGYELAQRWLNGGYLVRDICKRPVMTYYYSASRSGMRDQIIDTLKDRKLRPHYDALVAEDRDLPHHAADFMAVQIRTAIERLVPKAAQGMKFLKGLMGVLLKAGKELRWDSPLNFPVWQRYYYTKYERKHKVYEGTELRPQHIPEEDENAPRASKNRNAISPNFIHSLDATHLMMVVARLYNEGVDYVRVVHDSISVLPQDVALLDYVIRDEFIKLYGGDNDWLEDFEAQVRNIVGSDEEAQTAIDKLVSLRERGNLDLEEVRKSDFFFA